MKTIFVFFICSVSFLSCTKKGIQTNAKEKGVQNTLQITVNNLSEDANILSTHNDELVLLIYSKLEREFPKTILKAYFVMDSIGQSNVFKIKDKINKDENLILVLLEMDSERTLEGIEPTINANLNTLLTAYQNQDFSVINQLIGNEDLLTIEKFPFKLLQEKALRIQGISLFDAYDYSIQIK